jgi:hypothetical protein
MTGSGCCLLGWLIQPSELVFIANCHNMHIFM